MSAACGLYLNSKNLVPLPGACGMDCGSCGVNEKCGGCVPGTDPAAPECLERSGKRMGCRCPVLACAIESKVEHCPRCARFPCEVHYRSEIPYSRAMLDLFGKFREG